MNVLFAFILLISFFACIGLSIYGIINKIRHKPVFSKFKRVILISVATFFIAIAGVGVTADQTDSNDSAKTSKSISDKDSSSKRAASESIEKDKEASSQAESSSRAKQESIAASEKASSESAVKASSESAASSEKAARDSELSISESRARDTSNDAAQQQAKSVVAPDPTPAPSDNGSQEGTKTGSRWAIQDGFTWATRKGHSKIIAPGGSLPPGYHWQVQ